MKYVHAIRGSIVALVAFTIAAMFVPSNGPSEDVKIILTVSSFLFAIFAGFFISRLNGRYDKVKEIVADEDSAWLSLYKTSQYLGQGFTKKLSNFIDDYYITSYDYELVSDYYKGTAKYFHKIYDELDKVKIKGVKASEVFDTMVSLLNNIETFRNRASVTLVERVTKGQWAILLTLASIIIFSVFFLKTNTTYSIVLTVMLSTIIVLVILMMRDLQNFRLSGENPVTESGQELFLFIGKKRYYNQAHVKSGFNKIPDDVKEYRLGLHKPGEKRNIKLVKR